MNKSEKKKLAEILISMQHDSGATYETYNYAETIKEALPCVEEFVWELEESAYVQKISKILGSFLQNGINPAWVTHGKYRVANNLFKKSVKTLPLIIEDYVLDSNVLAEDLFEKLDENICSVEKSKRIDSILNSSLWKTTVDMYTEDVLERRYYKNQLEEYQLIQETQEEQ